MLVALHPLLLSRLGHPSKATEARGVNRGYFSKWGIITIIRSFTDLTEKYAELSFSIIVILPIPPKKDCILCYRAVSLLCKFIVKTGIKFHPVLYCALLRAKTKNEPSPTTKPVT